MQQWIGACMVLFLCGGSPEEGNLVALGLAVDNAQVTGSKKRFGYFLAH